MSARARRDRRPRPVVFPDASPAAAAGGPGLAGRTIRTVAFAGTAGSGVEIISGAVAGILELPYLDAHLTRLVAGRVGLSANAVTKYCDGLLPLPACGLGWIGGIAGMDSVMLGAGEALLDMADRIRQATEEVVVEVSRTGAVLVGEAAVCTLRRDPSVLRVLVTATTGRRVDRVADADDLSRRAARRLVTGSDRTASRNARFWWCAHDGEPSRFDLVVDTTSCALDEGVRVVAGSVIGNQPT